MAKTENYDATMDMDELVALEIFDELKNNIEVKEKIEEEINDMKTMIVDAATKVYNKQAGHVLLCITTPEDNRATVTFVNDSTEVVGDVSKLPKHLQVFFEVETKYKLNKKVDVNTMFDGLSENDKKHLQSVLRTKKNTPRVSVK